MPSRSLRSVAVIGLLSSVVLPASAQKSSSVGKAVASSAAARATMAACVTNTVAQGIPPRIAEKICALEVGAMVDKGFESPFVLPNRGGRGPVDPGAVSSCAGGGDVRRGKTPRPYNGLGDGTLAALEKATREAAAKEKDPKVKEELLSEADKMSKEADLRNEENGTYPDGAKPSKKRTVGGSTCEMVMASARDLVVECNRTGWKAAPCQEIVAKANKCPSPSLILVDPEAGYTCGTTPDARAVADAWEKQCQQRVKPCPGVTNPCAPLTPMGEEPRGHHGGAGAADACNDPRARVEGDVCFVPLKVGGPVQQAGTDEVIAMLSRFGGPVIVLPPKPPSGGGTNPDPRPGPRPGPVPKNLPAGPLPGGPALPLPGKVP